MKAEQIYSRRAAGKLSRLLDEAGFSPRLLERAETLAAKTSLDRNECFHLLSGDVPWSWSSVHKLCSTFDVQPGFFLDESQSIPASAMPVISAEGGAATVWCPPPGIGQSGGHTKSKLKYVVRAAPLSRTERPSLYVYRIRPVHCSDLIRDGQYVIHQDESLEVATFDHNTADSAIFSGYTDASIMRVPLPSDGNAISGIAGDVVGIVSIR